MTVQDVRTVAVPAQRAPGDAPLPPAAPAAAVPLRGRGRPATAEERQFAAGLVALLVGLETLVVGGLLVAEHVWT